MFHISKCTLNSFKLWELKDHTNIQNNMKLKLLLNQKMFYLVILSLLEEWVWA